ncbi:MAG: hypothetical protein WA539_17795 [Candidatus Sulfotelmatobacter sp.]
MSYRRAGLFYGKILVVGTGRHVGLDVGAPWGGSTWGWDLGLGPGAATWGCDLGLRLGAATWGCDLGLRLGVGRRGWDVGAGSHYGMDSTSRSICGGALSMLRRCTRHLRERGLRADRESTIGE